MIDPKQVDAYRQIKAPDTLKQRVMESAELRAKPITLNRQWQKALGGVACLVIVCIAAFFMMRPTPGAEVLYEGEPLSAEVISITPAMAAKAVPFGEKMVTPIGIPLEIKLSRETKISVSGGELQVYDPESGELLFVGTDLTAAKNMQVRWDLSGVENEILELSLNGDRHKAVYVLALNPDGTAVIYQKNEKGVPEK